MMIGQSYKELLAKNSVTMLIKYVEIPMALRKKHRKNTTLSVLMTLGWHLMHTIKIYY